MIIDQIRQGRSHHSRHYLLHTPDAFVRTPFPGLRNAAAIIHVARSAGATFAQYTVEFQDGGLLTLNAARHFLYVLEGEVKIEGRLLNVDEYVYIPAGAGLSATANRSARAVVIEIPPPFNAGNSDVLDFFVGRERSIKPRPVLGDIDLEVRTLMGNASTLEGNVVTLTYQPGATLPTVEASATDRSVLILSGGGISRLGEDWFRIIAGDFIWIGPACPQWFGALGKVPMRYLMYQHYNLGSTGQ